MAYRYSPDNLLPSPSSQAASSTAALGREFRISYSGSKNILIGVKCSSVVAGAGISVKLQSSFGGELNADWKDANSTSITGNGWVYIRMNVQNTADQSLMPLADVGRLYLTTGVGSSLTVDAAYVLQGL